MDFKTVSKKENPLMKREEVQATVGSEGATPSRKDILAEASKSLGSPEDCIIVDKVSTHRGKKESLVSLLIYKKKEDIPKHKLVKMEHRIFGAKKAETAPATENK